MKDFFHHFAHKTSELTGTPWAFSISVLIIAFWGITGPYFHFSDTWQLVINTGTTVITFLMVFLIQNTQNRDAVALHLKLDELIRSNREARNSLIDLEECSDKELELLHQEFVLLRENSLQTHQYRINAIEEKLKERQIGLQPQK